MPGRSNQEFKKDISDVRAKTTRGINLVICAFVAASPQVAIADTSTIDSPVVGTQGPVAPPLNGNDTLVITPQGSIQTTGNNANGVAATGGLNTIINNGVISTTGDSSRGIVALDGQNTIINTGTIRTINSAAIRTNNGGSNTITNSGVITTSGPGSSGIYATGNSNTISNSGSIRTTGPMDGPISPDGIKAEGSNNTITNSGSVISQQGLAIVFTGAGNTLNLLNSSFLAGGVELGTGTQINISTGANYSKLITYTGTLTSSTKSGAIPVFENTSTKQLATYDPTFFAASSDALGDMTKTISSLLPNRFNGSDKEHPLWVRGFGVKSNYDGTNATLDREYGFSGVALGYDLKRSNDLKFGMVGGYGRTTMDTNGSEYQSFNATSNDGFIGVYGQKKWGKASFDFGLYGGIQSFDQQRYINDNMATLGSSNANASYQGWWIAPEAGITITAGELNGWSVLPTARLRYAQQWMGGYTENGGGAANATVSSRNIGIGEGFVGIGTSKTMKTTAGKNTKMVLEGQVGYMYRGTAGDDTVGVTMIGQSLSLPTEASSRNAVAVSAGVLIDLSDTVALKIRGDAAAGSGMNYAWGGWAGLSVKF